MMINADNRQTAAVTAMLAYLEKRGVPEADRVLAEQYINGIAGDEVLDQFHRIDFYAATITYEVMNDMHTIMVWQDKEETKSAVHPVSQCALCDWTSYLHLSVLWQCR